MEKRGDRRGSGSERGRWSSRRKMEVVLRVLRGEDLDALSRELGVSASRLGQWRGTFLGGGMGGVGRRKGGPRGEGTFVDGAMAALRSRKGDHRDEEISRLREKLGELTMEKELLEAWFDRLDPADRPPRAGPGG